MFHLPGVTLTIYDEHGKRGPFRVSPWPAEDSPEAAKLYAELDAAAHGRCEHGYLARHRHLCGCGLRLSLVQRITRWFGL